MSTITKSIDINAPVHGVYNQWTQFEQFPTFMEGVEEVRQISDKRLFWRAKIAGKEKQWEAEIFEQVPDELIAWRSVDGTSNGGEVRFSSTGTDQTNVSLTIDFEPEGLIEKAGDVLGLVSGRIEGDLHRFRDLVERQGGADQGWRGEIHDTPGTVGSGNVGHDPTTAGRTDAPVHQPGSTAGTTSGDMGTIKPAGTTTGAGGGTLGGLNEGPGMGEAGTQVAPRNPSP